MDDDWGYPYDIGNPHISVVIWASHGLFEADVQPESARYCSLAGRLVDSTV